MLEFEQLVKVFFAEHGSKQDLLATLAELRTWLEELAVASQGIPHEYLEGRGPYPERLPWLILTGRFLDEFDNAVERWLDWATDVVRSARRHLDCRAGLRGPSGHGPAGRRDPRAASASATGLTCWPRCRHQAGQVVADGEADTVGVDQQVVSHESRLSLSSPRVE